MDLPGVMTFRDLDDVAAIETAAQKHRKAVVIGGGLLGLEAAYGLAKAGCKVSVVHLMDRLMERQLDARGSAMLKAAVEAKGIDCASRMPRPPRSQAGSVRRLSRSRTAAKSPADLVVVAAGIRANADLAQSAGLEVERGIVVDDQHADQQRRHLRHRRMRRTSRHLLRAGRAGL